MRASKIRSLGYWRSGERKTFHPSQLSPFLPQPNNGKDVPVNPHVLLFVLAFVFVCVQQRLFVCAGDHFSSVLCKHTSLHTFFLPSFEHLSPVYLTLSIWGCFSEIILLQRTQFLFLHISMNSIWKMVLLGIIQNFYWKSCLPQTDPAFSLL